MGGARNGRVEGMAACVQHRIYTFMKVSKFIERRKESKKEEERGERERGEVEGEKVRKPRLD